MNDFTKMSFEEKLGELSMTKAEFCRRMNIHPNTASEWTRKGQSPRFAHLYLDQLHANRALKAALRLGFMEMVEAEEA